MFKKNYKSKILQMFLFTVQIWCLGANQEAYSTTYVDEIINDSETSAEKRKENYIQFLGDFTNQMQNLNSVKAASFSDLFSDLGFQYITELFCLQKALYEGAIKVNQLNAEELYPQLKEIGRVKKDANALEIEKTTLDDIWLDLLKIMTDPQYDLNNRTQLAIRWVSQNSIPSQYNLFVAKKRSSPLKHETTDEADSDSPNGRTYRAMQKNNFTDMFHLSNHHYKSRLMQTRDTIFEAFTGLETLGRIINLDNFHEAFVANFQINQKYLFDMLVSISNKYKSYNETSNVILYQTQTFPRQTLMLDTLWAMHLYGMNDLIRSYMYFLSTLAECNINPLDRHTASILENMNSRWANKVLESDSESDDGSSEDNSEDSDKESTEDNNK